MMQQVADGQWNKGDKLYFYNPLMLYQLPIIAEFVPVGITRAINVDTCLEVNEWFSVAWFNCYLSRERMIDVAKGVLLAELQNLDSKKAEIQVKIDELK